MALRPDGRNLLWRPIWPIGTPEEGAAGALTAPPLITSHKVGQLTQLGSRICLVFRAEDVACSRVVTQGQQADVLRIAWAGLGFQEPVLIPG